MKFSSVDEKKRILSDPYTPIEVLPLSTSAGIEVSRRAVILDPHNEHIEAGIVSSEYHLVPNTFVRDTIESILQSSQLTATLQDQSTIWDGRHFRLKYVFDDVEAEVRSQHPHDFIKLSLDGWNSYDGSAKFGVSFNVFRLICLNGMIMSHRLGGFAFKHEDNNGYSMSNQVDRAVQRLMSLANSNALFTVAENFTRMSDMSMSLPAGLAMLDNLGFGDLAMVDAVRSVADDTRQSGTNDLTPSVWDWYNGATRALTNTNSFSTEKKGKEVSKAFLELVSAN